MDRQTGWPCKCWVCGGFLVCHAEGQQRLTGGWPRLRRLQEARCSFQPDFHTADALPPSPCHNPPYLYSEKGERERLGNFKRMPSSLAYALKLDYCIKYNIMWYSFYDLQKYGLLYGSIIYSHMKNAKRPCAFIKFLFFILIQLWSNLLFQIK